MNNNSSSSKVLVPGMLIKTNFLGSNKWITNIIASVKGGIITIPLLEEYFSENILNEEIILIDFINEGVQYKIRGKVTDVDITSSQTMSVVIIDFTTYKDIRKSPRYYTNLGAKLYSESLPEPTIAIITNISKIGLCFISKNSYPLDLIIYLSVLHSLDKVIQLKGKIIRSTLRNNVYENAIIFDSDDIISGSVKDMINDYEQETTNIREFLHKKFSNYLKEISKSFLNTKIVLLESSNLVRMIVKNAINDAGITNIYEASDCQTALELIKQYNPEIVCLSNVFYEIENKDIFEDIHLINPDIKILIMSSTPESQLSKEIMAKHNIDFIPKSSSFDKLINTIKNHWK